ncbi:MAG: gamma-glutamylcyclotransferase [Rhodomicrobiaceae bacterium]
MQDGDLSRPGSLFVYGTLMKVSGSPMAKRLHAESAYVGPGRIRGSLYLLGYYPGLVRAERNTDCVFGEVVKLRNPLRSLRWLDSYEGCGPDDPEPRMYERVIVPVTLRSGETVTAWTYLYKGNVALARRLPGGRFLKNRPCG